MNHFFLFIIKITSYFPLGFLKVIAFCFYIMNFIFRYRYRIVYNNLKIAFPDKSNYDIRKIQKLFYKYFFNLMFEIIKFTNVKHTFINNHVNITNPELLEELLKNNNVILLSGHYNNWEWMGAKISIYYKEPFIAIYKRLNSSVFNNFLLESRKRFGSLVLDMDDSIRYLLQNNDQFRIIGIIPDQNPVVNSTTKWSNFFDKDIPVFLGPEKIARRINSPVVFCNMKKIDNKNYSITFELITKEPRTLAENRITKYYFNLLEKQIKEEPSKWLWTHKRWRHQKK